VGKPAWIRAKMEQSAFPSPSPEPWVLAVLQVSTGGCTHNCVPAAHGIPQQHPCEAAAHHQALPYAPDNTPFPLPHSMRPRAPL